MKNSIFLLLFLFEAVSLASQPNIQWQKTYGGSNSDEPNRIRQTADGGYVIAGRTGSSDGDIFGHKGGWDLWVIKVDINGAFQWKKVLGGSENDGAYDVFQTQDGGYFLTGTTASNNYDVLGNHGDFDGWAVKLGSLGNIEWQKPLGGSLKDEIWSARQTIDLGYILAGRSRSSDGDLTENKGLYDCWVVKLDQSGNIEWQKSFGGSKDDEATGVILTTEGGYLVVAEGGSQDGDISDPHGSVDYWLIKLSDQGELEWQKNYGGAGADFVSDVLQAEAGDYVITGYTTSDSTGDVGPNNGVFDFWTIKVSSIGELIWQNIMGGSNPDWGRAIAPSSDGSFLIAGTTASFDYDVIGNHGEFDFWLVKLTADGEFVWQKTYGGSQSESCFGIDNTSDNGFILAGYAWSSDGDLTGSTNHGQNDFWVVKLSPETSSTTDIQHSNLIIYPNPASSYISFQPGITQVSLHVSVFDMLGRELIHQEFDSGSSLDISSLPPGYYCVTVLDDNGQLKRGLFEKVKQ